MERDMKFVQIINDENQREVNFFLKKLINDLKKDNIQMNLENLEQLVLEAVNSYTKETPSRLYDYCLNIIKKECQIGGKAELTNIKFVISKEFQVSYNDSKQEKLTKEIKTQNPESVHHPKTKNKKDVQFLKDLYQKKGEDSYYSLKELSKLLNYKYDSILKKKKKIFTRIEEEPAFQTFLLESYPTFYEDQESYKVFFDQKKKQERPSKKERDIQFLKDIYRKKENDSYYSSNELSELLNYDQGSFVNKKKRLLKKIEEDISFRIYLLEQYPTFYEDRKNYETYFSDNAKDVRFLKDMYQKREDGSYYLLQELPNILNYALQTLKRKKNKIFKRIQEESDFQSYLLEHYPSFYVDRICSKLTRRASFRSKGLEMFEELTTIIPNFEQNILKDYTSVFTMKQKIILILRLGFFQERVFSISEITRPLIVTEQEVNQIEEYFLNTIEVKEQSFESNTEKEKCKII